MGKLLILVPAFPKKDGSTSYTVPFIQQFLLAFLKKYNVQLDVITLYVPSGNVYMWNQIKVIPLNGNPKDHLLNKGIFILKAAHRILKLFKEGKYDGILSFWYRETAMIGNLLSSRLSIKHYTWLQGQDVRHKNRYMRFVRPKPDKLIALSQYQNDFLYKEFGMRAHKIAPVAVNPSFFPMLNKGDRPIDILGAGSLTKLKNHRFFLEVIAEVKQKRGDLKVVLIGNGPMETEYRTFIKNNGLGKTVTLTGLLSHSETMRYMNMSKIFFHTSKFEGGGMVCSEALYSGCYLISTLPLIKNCNDKFSLLSGKKDIVDKIHSLLGNYTRDFERCVENPMEKACSIIYDLFF